MVLLPWPSRLWLLWSVLGICLAQAESQWDDFSNNLATDVTPLISLFGEQVTKQFLSESLTLLDNFIFAMAPLGILTAVVSAIRVCGTSSLRAFIGRAQEGDGVVEAELCSSTSPSVCEIYNKGGITRVFGRPKILEVIFNPNSDEFYGDANSKTPQNAKAGIHTFQEYIETKTGSQGWAEVRRRKAEDVSHEKTPNLPKRFAENPNLSLNIGIRRVPRRILWITAILGFMLQAGFIVFALIVTYRLRWGKDNQPPYRWACPLAVSGTILLSAGMFVCAWLIEQSTSERLFRRSPCGQKGAPASLHWIQPGNQFVGDQIFDAFAYSDAGTLEEYITSYKVSNSQDPPLVWLAVILTIVGYVLQFVGLRGMHASVSIFQLGAMLVMSVLRAGLRTRRFRTDENDLSEMLELVQGHELDWQALQFQNGGMDKGADATVFWEVNNLSSWSEDVTLNKAEEDRGIVWLEGRDGVGQKCLVFGTTSDAKENETQFLSSIEQESDSQIGLPKKFSPTNTPSLAVKLARYRSRLAYLTSEHFSKQRSATWSDQQIQARSYAKGLTTAIEEASEILFSDLDLIEAGWGDKESIYWGLDILTGDQGHSPVFLATRHFDDPTNGGMKRWMVSMPDIEAVLGLWTWTLKRKYKLKDSDRLTRVLWGDKNHQADISKLDVAVWIDNMRSNPVHQGRDSKPNPRLFGLQTIPADAQHFITISRDKTPPVEMCAQDIFISFLIAATRIIREIGGPTTPVKGYRNLHLVNSKISKLAKIFQESGLGSEEDAFLCIIPALRSNSKLPSVSGTLSAARESASDLRRKGDWKQAEELLQWSVEVSDTAGNELRSATALCELLRWALLDENTYRRAKFDPSKGIEWLQQQDFRFPPTRDKIQMYSKVYDIVQSKIGDGSEDILEAEREEDFAKALACLQHGIDTKLAAFDGLTALHWAAIRTWPEVVEGLLEIGADPNMPDRYQRTPLSYAAESGNLEIVDMLVRAGAFIHKADECRKTSLSFAAGSGRDSVVQYLLSFRGVNPESRDNNGRNSLHWVAIGGSASTAEMLLNGKDAKVALLECRSYNGCTPTITALHHANIETAAYLVNEGATYDIEVDKTPAWNWLLQQGKLDSCNFLLQKLSSDPRTAKRVVLAVSPPGTHLLPQNVCQKVGDSATDASKVVVVLFSEAGTRETQISLCLSRIIGDQFEGRVIDIGEEGAEPEEFPKLISGSGILAKIFLAAFKAELKITEDALAAAAAHERHSLELMKMLLEVQQKLIITSAVLAAAAGNKGCGLDAVKFLLSRCPRAEIGKDTLISAGKNWGCGMQVIQFLVESRPGDLEFYRGIVRAEVSKDNEPHNLFTPSVIRWSGFGDKG